MTPLDGLVVVELAGMGPGPFAAMLLADHGADVVRVVRPGTVEDDPLAAGRRVVEIDLKSDAGREQLLGLVETADVLLEGFRPGTTERLGLGPDVCLARNPRLVYGRMTGWGQDGPLAHEAGHDINYVAVAGALGHIGRADQPPTPPLNLIGDLGGGAMMAFGLLAGVLRARETGSGCLVDTAMLDTTLLFMTQFRAWRHTGDHDETTRGNSMLDSGAPYYDVYACSDGGHVAVGAIENQFFAKLVAGLGIADHASVARRLERDAWPDLRAAIAEAFLTGTRDEWTERFAGTDACVSPVLSMAEVAEHPQVRDRGGLHAAGDRGLPAPRFSSVPR